MDRTSPTPGPWNVSRETAERLQAFAALFERWSQRINLVSARTRGELLTRHIADSLQIARLNPNPKIWIDLGSGGGFPGLITGIALAEAGEGWVHLVESNHKKAAFLRAAIVDTGARASVHPERIEAVQIAACDAVSARALAELDALLALSQRWVSRPGVTAWFHKGRDYAREVAKARARWNFDLIEHASTIEPDSVILEIRNLAGR
ncbi:MAG: 16S rRNA (guanine(527)-N(7))-methyltransferase RsmG [Pararhizobium sp.]